ncbi:MULTISPECIES: peptide deformylase [unclassified Desulfobacter]|jgi:peptide deformylase|uniref:peptide deformylase n=1 Tax=unclassified Desulfobacter TaxID=2634406 RepID=UPI000E901A64|nr:MULTISPECIES: peptide deformylase [unclassified Desulfobacter]MBP9598374.1 peptide deformylase [Desulfobacter sp.]MDQ1268742.1 peptide deformylase [Thermodesulfobacteriota bacterium]HBT87228.1 peptide deformylase [Desulfobacter sp.]
MATLDIVTFPEPSLKMVSVPVETIDEELKTFIEDMGETMFHDSGVGLAAPQVGVNRRVIVYDPNAAEEQKDPEDKTFIALINPEILSKSKETFISEQEGCLSVVDYRADVRRHASVTVRAMNIDGETIEFEAHGLMSVIMQHEIDHLDGILFIDRISALKRAMYKKRRLKQLKNEK